MTRGPLILAGVLIGIGLGGFLDGIFFHQILQLHSMLSAVVPPDNLANVRISMRWDGYFQLCTWTVSAAGIAVLWSAAKRVDVPWSGRTFWGALLVGWGSFNFCEGLIDHHLLGLHHVVERLGLSVWDYLFLISGLVIAATGFTLIERARRPPMDELAHSPPPVSE